MNKDNLRKELIKIRKNIYNKNDKSTIIVNKIIRLKNFINAKVVALYKCLPNEVNIDYLIDYSQNCGKTVLLPKVVDNDLIFMKIDNNTLYEKSSFHVLEPVYDEKKVYNGDIDLIVVPGLGFDKNYNRIGYGKGYYDRFLKNKDIIKIGVCYSEQLKEKIIIESNDIPMDLIIHDKYKDDVYEFFTIKEMEEVKYIKNHSNEYKKYKNIDELTKLLK